MTRRQILLCQDYFSLRKHTSCFPIKGHMLSVSKVPFTKQIQLALPMNFDLAFVKKHVNALIEGKDKAEFDLNEENGLAVVTFERHESNYDSNYNSNSSINLSNDKLKLYYVIVHGFCFSCQRNTAVRFGDLRPQNHGKTILCTTPS